MKTPKADQLQHELDVLNAGGVYVRDRTTNKYVKVKFNGKDPVSKLMRVK
jgi:hypothetical protein